MADSRKAAAAGQSEPIQRSKALTIWLVLLLVQSALGVYLILDLTKRPEDPTRPYLLAGLLILSVIQLAGISGIWLWKKWGLYAYAGAVVGTASIGLLLTGTLLIVFYELLPVAVTGWLLRDMWDNFLT